MKSTIEAKKAVLEKAREYLKSKYEGLDEIIDIIITKTSAWYLMIEHLDRPHIINLWGLTGCGKTSVVKDIIKELDFELRSAWIQFGGHHMFMDLQYKVFNNYEKLNGQPLILVIDEFQHARTLNQMGQEFNYVSSLWDALDTGNISMSRKGFGGGTIQEVSLDLQFLIEHGLTIKDGYIYGQKELIIKREDLIRNRHLKSLHLSNKEKNFIFDSSMVSEFIERCPDYFSSVQDVVNLFSGCSNKNIINKLSELSMTINSHIDIDCSKALIFVIGNLDEAFPIHADFNRNMDPDVIRYLSQKVTVEDIREALKKRFRVEHIARLGSTHIIYHTPGKKHYENLFRRKLTTYFGSLSSQFTIEISYDEDLIAFLMKTAIYPTLGVRITEHIFQSMIMAHTPSLIIKAMEAEADKIIISAEKSSLKAKYFKNKKEISEYWERVDSLHNKKRVYDDLAYPIAVHEAGHTLLSITLQKYIPEQVFMDLEGVEGRTCSNSDIALMNRKMLLNELAMLFGGYIAEKLVFGEEKITNGSLSDLRRATILAERAIRSESFGETHAYIENNAKHHAIISDFDNSTNREIRALLHEGEKHAEATLSEQLPVLLTFANYLIEKRNVSAADIRDFLKKQAFPLPTENEKYERDLHEYKVLFDGHLRKMDNEFIERSA